MMIPREQIRPAIKEMETIEELQALINVCFATPEEDAEFVRECASEIYHREKVGRMCRRSGR